MTKSDYTYIAYVDEAGDDGLKQIRRDDRDGATEWFILGATLVRAVNEDRVPIWEDDLRSRLRHAGQAKTLHFRKLSGRDKKTTCDFLGTLPVRHFAVISNKRNMENYRNERAEMIPSQNEFYNFMIRLLLERITYYVARRPVEEHGGTPTLRIEYSRRSRFSYSQNRAYLTYIRGQGSNLFLKHGSIDFKVLSTDQIQSYPHDERPGLIFADIVASAFYRACDQRSTDGIETQFAERLAPRIAKPPGRRIPSGFGVKLMPLFRTAQLSDAERAIFYFYGYPDEWWQPKVAAQSSSPPEYHV